MSSRCAVCGKEELLPFKCPFCNDYFCVEHRLPENHSCQNTPKRTPLGPWKTKRIPRSKQEPDEMKQQMKKPTPELVNCPKCGSKRTMITAVKAEYDVFECLKCQYKWKHLGEVEKSAPARSKGKRKIPTKKIVALSIIVIVVCVVLWNAPKIYSVLQNFLQQSSYAKVTVVEGQVAQVGFDGNVYGFSLQHPDKFMVVTPLFEYKIYPAVEGAVYSDLGIEIVVSEVHSDYIVLLVKPLY